MKNSCFDLWGLAPTHRSIDDTLLFWYSRLDMSGQYLMHWTLLCYFGMSDALLSDIWFFSFNALWTCMMMKKMNAELTLDYAILMVENMSRMR